MSNLVRAGSTRIELELDRNSNILMDIGSYGDNGDDEWVTVKMDIAEADALMRALKRAMKQIINQGSQR